MTTAIASAATNPARARRRVRHWFRLSDLELAREVGGLTLITYCGRARHAGSSGRPVVVQTVGGLMAVNRSQDCKSCVRAYEAQLQREGRRRLRWFEANGV